MATGETPRGRKRREFLAKADDAAVLAKTSHDPFLRTSWAKIEVGYRELAAAIADDA
jgi:hypothetical protein